MDSAGGFEAGETKSRGDFLKIRIIQSIFIKRGKHKFLIKIEPPGFGAVLEIESRKRFAVQTEFYNAGVLFSAPLVQHPRRRSLRFGREQRRNRTRADCPRPAAGNEADERDVKRISQKDNFSRETKKKFSEIDVFIVYWKK
jgi:hypothetical protein